MIFEKSLIEVVSHTNSKFGILSKEKQIKIEIYTDRVVVWKKGKKKKAVTIPLKLVWFNSQPEHSDRKGEDKKFSLLDLTGPERTWRLALKSSSERSELAKHLKTALKAVVGDLNAPRKTKYAYSEGIGTYRGEWVNGCPHGRGVFTCKDGVKFDGHWSSLVSAGYGKIITENGCKTGGWESFFPQSPPKESLSDVTESGKDEEFNEDDIKTLLKDSTIRTYSKNEVILQEGEANDCFFRIKSGAIRLEKTIEGRKSVLTTMGPDQMFGEMSILDKNITSATVVADSNEVELYAVELSLLLEILKSNDGLSKRFHKIMAQTLASRLSKPLNDIGEKGHKDSITRQRCRTTFSGFLVLDQKQKLETEDPPEVVMAKNWIDAWNQKDKYSEFYSNNVLYRDPFVPEGIVSLKNLSDHFSHLSETNRMWEWDDIEFFRVPEGFTLRSKIHLKSSNNRSLREHSLALIILDNETHKITRCEIYFDLTKVKSVKQEHKVAPSVLDSPIRRRPKDHKYSLKFGLDENQIIAREYRCISTGMSGKLYISQNYTCFYSKVFGMKTKEVIHLPDVSDIKRKPDSLVVMLLYKKTQSSKRESGNGDVKKFCIRELELTFSSANEADEAFEYLISSWNTNKEMYQAKESIQAEPKNASESLLADYSHLHEKLPNFKIKHAHNDQCIRITLPNDNETGDGYLNDVAGRIVSTYPRKSHIGLDGSIQLDTVKQGSPICDQLCLERFENKTIVALADGCNWGKKPRDAALKASRTFCEYVKRNLNETYTVQDAGKLFLQAIVQAHKRIIEGVKDNWWDCGTTTLIGGCIFETVSSFKRDGSSWAFVCASVGDCKVFRLSAKTGFISDISSLRSGNASIDATDCGGRIGPFLDGGKPDFRNLDVFYEPLNEDDLVIVVSDGLHDNLDPQSLGLTPSDIGLVGDNWSADIEGLSAAKSKYMCQKISEIVYGENRQESSHKINLDPNEVVEKLINYAIRTTERSKVFMETFPEQNLPVDYKLFPGKLDHTSCVCVKVKKSSFNHIEHHLDKLVIRMRHPIKGLQLGLKGKDDGQIDKDKLFIRRVDMLRRHSTLSGYSFKGYTIKKWLRLNESIESFQVDRTAQLLLNFKYIKPVTSDSWKDETFDDDTTYTFQVYEPIMTQNDWRLLLQGARIVQYQKGEYIIREGDTRKRVFHIITGKCVTEKDLQSTSHDTRIVVNTMSENETFGEISFLSEKASANVRAETDVQIYVIDWTWINILFVKHPKLAGRFYHYLASMITHRIKKQEIFINSMK